MVWCAMELPVYNDALDLCCIPLLLIIMIMIMFENRTTEENKQKTIGEKTFEWV